MRKFRSMALLLVVALMISMLSLPIVSSAAEPGYVYDFYYEDDLLDKYLISGAYCCETEWEDHALKIVAADAGDLGDTYFYINSIADEGMEASDYPYMAFSVKNLSDATEYEGHFGTSQHAISGSTVFHVDIDPNMTEFKTFIVNMPQSNHDNVNRINAPGGISDEEGATANLVAEMEDGETAWEGEVTTMRFDSIYRSGRSGEAQDGDTLYIAWMAFFETEEDAKNYKGPDHSVERTPEPTRDPSTVDTKPFNLLVFDTDDYDDFFNPTSMISEIYFDSDKKCYCIDVTAGIDPNLELLFDSFMDEEVPCDEYKILQFGARVNTAEGNKSGSFYYSTDEHGGYSEPQNIIYNYATTDEIQVVNIDLTRAANWTGIAQKCRFDVFTTTNEDTTVELYYMAFFSDKAAADAFADLYRAQGSEAFPAKPTKAPTAEPTEKPTEKPTDAPKVTDAPKPTDAPKTTDKAADNTGEKNNKWILPVAIGGAVVLAAAIAGIAIGASKKKKK